MQAVLAVLGGIIFFGFGVVQFFLGYLGIEHNLGVGWAITAVMVALLFRFTLPLTVGSFFGVVDVLGWHWIWGALIAVPGLVFMIPGAFVMVFGFIGQAIYFNRIRKSYDRRREALDADVIDVESKREP